MYMNRLFIFLSIQHCLHRCERYVVFVDCVVNVITMFTSILLSFRIVHETIRLEPIEKGKSYSCWHESEEVVEHVRSRKYTFLHAVPANKEQGTFTLSRERHAARLQKCTRNAGCHYNSDVNDFEYFADWDTSLIDFFQTTWFNII